MMKKIILFALTVMMLMAFATTALAYSYDFAFDPPFVGSMESTTLKSVSGNPYVDPDGSAASTCYFLSSSRYSSTAASNIITKSNGSKSYFTYKQGYGGSGTSLCMSGYPAATDFVAYSIGGSWMP